MFGEGTLSDIKEYPSGCPSSAEYWQNYAINSTAAALLQAETGL